MYITIIDVIFMDALIIPYHLSEVNVYAIRCICVRMRAKHREEIT